MRRRVIRRGLGIALTLPVLGLCLFGDCAALKSRGVLPSALAELTVILGDTSTQWMLFACAGMYLVAFAVLRRRVVERGRLRVERWALQDPGLWMPLLMILAAGAYAFHYPEAAKSTQALTLIGAGMMGQAVGLLESRKQKVESRNGTGGTVVLALVVLLAGAAVWRGETGMAFQYRGQARWCGPWENPNTFGVLMGVGFVLAVGALLERLKAKGLMLKSPPSSDYGAASPASSDCGAAVSRLSSRVSYFCFLLSAFLLLLAACVMAVGLLKSYSRGAWVGTAVGLAMLARLKAKGQMLKEGETRIARIGTNAGKSVSIGGIRVWLIVVALSASVLLFWSLQDTQWVPARRAVSVANANDFSWRNRVAAWEGALQMMAEKPWFGYGWNQPERVYDQFYRPSKVPEGAAIQLNDYFTLGTTLGIPALLCFVIYVSLSLRGSPKSKVQSPKPEAQGPAATLAFSLQPLAFQSACRAGAVVLLVGFWFDGGLFKLAMAAPFWILLELGREDTDCTDLHE